MLTTDPHQYLKGADLLFDQQQVADAISGIARRLNIDLKDASPVVLSVMTGATLFTGELTSQLNFPMELDYVHATRYQVGIEGKQVHWIVKPKPTVKGRTVLVLDDILDEGVTLKAIVDACYALEAKDVKVAVLADKVLDKEKPIPADYIGLSVPNRYVFGYGMDVYGWWRNLPAIYALKEESK